MRRQSMQVTIEAIIEAAGKTEEFEKALEQHRTFHVSIENKPYMRLVIEVLPENQVSVAHYYTQNGDAMRDPEVVFRADTWHAIEWTMDGLGIYRRAPKNCYLKDTNNFAHKVWAMNLRHQGFIEAAKTLAR